MRIEGWESALSEYIEAARGLTFAWGVNDCALWCARWAEIATGTDYAAAWAGRYANEYELAALIADRGLGSAADIPGSVGLPEINPGFAARGDVVLWNGCLGVCNGVQSHFLTESGVVGLRTRACQRAWKVG